MARANVIAPPFSLILGCLMNGHTCLFNLEKKIKSKPFSVLVASNVIGSLLKELICTDGAYRKDGKRLDFHYQFKKMLSIFFIDYLIP